jgi:hypothetical protein
MGGLRQARTHGYGARCVNETKRTASNRAEDEVTAATLVAWLWGRRRNRSQHHEVGVLDEATEVMDEDEACVAWHERSGQRSSVRSSFSCDTVHADLGMYVR